jgi:hypothetical protein
MDERRRIGMRRLVKVTVEQLSAGAVQPAEAARLLYAAGVPFNVIGRVTTSTAATTAAQRAA